MSTPSNEPSFDDTHVEASIDCKASSQPVAPHPRQIPWRILGGTLVGVIPGIVIILYDGYGGPGITFGGAIIGFLAAYERIRPLRLLSLAFFAMVGNVPLAGKVAELTIESTEHPIERSSNNLIEDWLLGGSKQSHPWVIAVGLFGGALLIGVLFVCEWMVSSVEGTGKVSGITHFSLLTTEQWMYACFCSSSILAAIVTLRFSPAHRRPILLAGLVGCLFGAIVGLTQPLEMMAWASWTFLVLAVFATQIFSVLIALIEIFDRH